MTGAEREGEVIEQMADRMCAPPRIRRSEFQIVTDPNTGVTARQFGLCGPTATASALSSTLGREVTVQDTYRWMRQHGFTDANGAFHPWAAEGGASTLSGNLTCAARGFGASVVESSGFHNPWPDWLAFLRRHAGMNPVVFEVSAGQALKDTISGLGENAVNLQFHFPTVLGYHVGGVSDVAGGRDLAEGFWCADGCNFAGGNSRANDFNAADKLQFYPVSVMQAAALVGAFALKGRDMALTIDQASQFYSQNPDGTWRCTQTGKTIRGGMLDWYRAFVGTGSLNGLSDLGLPLTDEIPVGAPKAGSTAQPTIQVFERGAGFYDPDRVFDDPPGAAGSIYKAHITRPEVLAIIAPPTS
jgi:hypothetical protein